MESSVKNTHLWDVWQESLHCIHPLDVGRIVERSQVVAGSKSLHHLWCEEHRLVELLPAMHHSVPHSTQFFKALKHSIFTSSEYLENILHTCGMLCDKPLHLMLLAIQLHCDERIRSTDFLYTTTCYHALIIHVVERIFDRTATTVQHKNLFHVLSYYPKNPSLIIVQHTVPDRK